MKQFIRFTITFVMGIIAFGFQSCGTSEKSNSTEDSVNVDASAIIDEDGNIVLIDEGDGVVEDVGVVEETEANPIDESLERLTNAMAQYMKASASGNDVLKQAYADDISTEVRFLNQHKNEMTDSQKQLYAKLNAIEI
jgi:hypothetical protein